MRKEKKERKAKRKEKERKRGKRGKRFLERKGRKRRRKGKRKIFPGFGRSTFESSRTKVGTRSGIYVWTPKSWSFDKLQKVGYFPTWFIFSLKAL